jgi:hypothetical protein
MASAAQHARLLVAYCAAVACIVVCGRVLVAATLALEADGVLFVGVGAAPARTRVGADASTARAEGCGHDQAVCSALVEGPSGRIHEVQWDGNHWREAIGA